MKTKILSYIWKMFFTLSTILYFFSDIISSSFIWDKQIVLVDGSPYTTGGFTFLPTYLEFVVVAFSGALLFYKKTNGEK